MDSREKDEARDIELMSLARRRDNAFAVHVAFVVLGGLSFVSTAFLGMTTAPLALTSVSFAIAGTTAI